MSEMSESLHKAVREVDEVALQCHTTLERSDLGRKYIIVQGCLHFLREDDPYERAEFHWKIHQLTKKGNDG